MRRGILAFFFMVGVSLSAAMGQAISTNGGSIQGTITDPTGAVVPGATIVISSPDTGYSHTMKTDSAGVYSLGPLIPGKYTISITAPSFQRLSVTTIVQTGTVTSGNEKLVLGNASETIEVNAATVQINTEQMGVAGVVTQEQIDTLPVNGRNILDIAQLQPGVILQSGQTFDPTKTAYSALAVNGQNGRSTRILVDGQDVSDETVGTTLFNIPEGAIGEFQLNRSTQDVSGSVTSTGQLLLSTQSGTNRIHGNAFGIFQDARAGFAAVNGVYAPFQRDQFGGYVGGYIWKDKLFFFGGGERLKQADSSPVQRSNANFTAIYNQYPVVPDPFKDTFSMGRLDYNGPWGVHYFVRATYSNNIGFGTAGQAPYALFSNQDNVPAIVGGADFTTGRFTHSLRYGYIKFINNLASGANALGNTVYNPSLTFGFPTELIGAIYAGAGNEDAPQKTYQSSKDFRYDGTWTKGSHNFKYGGEISRILEGGFAAFYSTFLTDISTSSVHLLANCGGQAGAAACPTDPLNGYKPTEYVFGNGNGSGSERPAFGLPGGGNFSWRMSAYIGDTWKATPSLTLVAGLRWSVDTDRSNQDVPTPTCGQVDPSLQWSGCSSANPSAPLFEQFGPGLGLGQKTQQNYANFGPQAGFVFSPGSHKMAIRGGAGIYYENNLFNNQGNARAQNITAEFPAFTYGLNTYTQTTLSLPGYVNGMHGVTSNGVPCNVGSTTTDPGCISWPTIYSMSIAQATPIMFKLDQLYKAASAVPQPNGSFIGTGGGLEAISDYAGPYKTPYSIQINGGVQYELKKGLVISADYIHNATLKVPLTIDTNRVGAARYFNSTAAKAAIAALLSDCGAPSIDAAIAACPGIHPPANGKPAGPATIADLAGEGLDSGKTYLGGQSASANGVSIAEGAAFPGINANVGEGGFILPVGKSAYDALQIVLQQQKSHPLPGIVSSNMQISYNFSRAITTSGGGSNQFFAGSGPYDQDCPTCFMGHNDLDRTNQISLGGNLGLKYGMQVAVIGHFFSAPPSTLTLAGVTGGGQIFKTDVDGDGTTADLLPGTTNGDYMRRLKGAGLLAAVSNYNATQAGTLTPAGQTVVASGLVTAQEMSALGGVKQPLIAPPADPLRNSTQRTLDASVKYPINYFKRWREGLVITPGVTMYNVTNMANFGSFGTLVDTTTTPATLPTSTYLNGPNNQDVLNRTRTNRGSGNGTFDQGGPRSTEFSLKVQF